MYSEIQEAVNFLCNFLYSKIPRRKISTFAEQLANFLALKFQDRWDPNDPQKENFYRVLKINCQNETDPLLSVTATSVGLELEELLQYWPMELRIWVNPGEVKYRVGETGLMTALYCACESNGSTMNKLMSLGPGGDNQLKLNMNSQVGANWLVNGCGSGGGSPVFEVSSINDVKFTVGSFAMTRFGTTKQKTNLATLKQIQRKATFTAADKARQAAMEGGSGGGPMMMPPPGLLQTQTPLVFGGPRIPMAPTLLPPIWSAGGFVPRR